MSDKLLSTINSLLSNSSVSAIVMPQPNSFAELPVMYRDGDGTVRTGRIDRVILTDTEVRLYDYKTFKVSKKEIPAVAKEYYDNQLKMYEEACHKLWPGRKVSSFLIFTALPLIVPANS